MNIGMWGIGKLGLPVALAIESSGHLVYAYDKSEAPYKYLRDRKIPYQEEIAPKLLAEHNIQPCSKAELYKNSDIIFVAVQTPHDPKYEGTLPIYGDNEGHAVDFDYSHLKEAITDIAALAADTDDEKIVVIISTCLPGTLDREIKPILRLSKGISLVYNPFFIAMGTTIPDFLMPEFVLIGIDGPMEEIKILEAKMEEFYKTIHYEKLKFMSIREAELTKVAYNTFISMKIAYVNTLMEICQKMGMRVNKVTNALKLADRRLMSSMYLSGGMGDGGGCHPRDNIAMSWLANKLELSHDIFRDIMKAREEQTRWLAGIVENCYKLENMPIVMFGTAFKAGTNIVTGSPAILLTNLLKEKGLEVISYDPWVIEHQVYAPPPPVARKDSYIAFIGTKHEGWLKFNFPSGCTIIDPWRYLTHLEGRYDITYLPIGGTQTMTLI